jgi:hypothetical protein
LSFCFITGLCPITQKIDVSHSKVCNFILPPCLVRDSHAHSTVVIPS